MELEHARLLQQGWHQLPDKTYRKGKPVDDQPVSAQHYQTQGE